MIFIVIIFLFFLGKFVQYYKFISLIILISNLLISETDTLKINYDNFSSKKNNLKYFIENWRSENFYNGELRKELLLKSIKHDEKNIFLIWSDTLSNPLFIDTVIYKNYNSNDLITKIINLNYLGKKATKENLFDLKKKFNYPFIKFLSDPNYMIYDKNNLALFIPIKINFQNFFSGIIGFTPENGFSGNIDLSLSNIFDLSTTMDFNWMRLNDKSQDIFFQYSIPFIKNFNYGIIFNFSQSLQNNFFVKYSNEFQLTSIYSKYGKYSFGIKTSNNNPTNIGFDNGYRPYKTKNILLTNYFELNQNFSFNQKIIFGDYLQNFQNQLIFNYSFNGLYKYKINNLFNLNFYLKYGKVYINDEISIPDGEKFRFGGAKTFRGYQEFFFISDEFIINQIELIYDINKSSKLFSFLDVGKANMQLSNIFSYGLGITQPISLGYLKLEYAVNQFDKISNGKIHITILSNIR